VRFNLRLLRVVVARSVLAWVVMWCIGYAIEL